MENHYNYKLKKLGSFLMSASLYEDAWMVHNIIKIARTKNKVKSIFMEAFPEDKGKAASVSVGYYNKFKGTEKLEEANLIGFLAGKTLEDVISTLKGKPKEKQETALERFKKSNLIPKELLELLGAEQEAELLELEQSDISKKNYPWAIKVLMNDEEDPMFEIITAIKIWDRNKEDLAPLESFRNMSHLRGSIDGLGTASKSAYLYSIKNHALDPKNTDTIYDSNNFTVVLSGTTMSSQWWAQGTVWCTSYLEGNMFERYSSDGIYLYYLISKNDKAIKEYDKLHNDTRPVSRYSRRYAPRRNAENLEKISIGYVKKDGKPILLTDQNATVDKANHNISEIEIRNYLGDEADDVFSAIERDLDGRDETKFEQIKRSTTPEALEQQLALLEAQDMEWQAEELVRYFLEDKNVREDTVEYAAKWFFDRGSEYWSTDVVYHHDGLNLSDDYPFHHIREKYRKMEAERLIDGGEYELYLRSQLLESNPEYLYTVLKNIEYGSTGQQEEERKSYRGREWRVQPLTISELLNYADNPEYYTDDEFFEIKANIKKNFEKALSLNDKSILYLNNPLANRSHLDNIANLYDGGKQELYEVMRPAAENALLNYSPAAYFSMGWNEVYPDLEDKVIDSIIAIDPIEILLDEHLKKNYKDLIPVGIWGTTIEDIISLDLHKKYKSLVQKLFMQINAGGRIPNHPLLFTIKNKDKLRSQDLKDLASRVYILEIFTDMVKGQFSDHGGEQDKIDERLHGMKLDHMLPEKPRPRGISEELRDAIEKEEDKLYAEDYYHDYYEDMVGPEPDIIDEEEEEEGEEKGDTGDFTWGANIPELQRLIEDNNREARISRLRSFYKLARLGAA